MTEGETPQPLQVRFGDVLMEKGFTAVPNLILDLYRNLGITANEMLFSIHIWQFWWSRKEPYPSLITIAERMGISRRQAGRYVETLKEKELLNVRVSFEIVTGQVTNHYDFSPMLKKIEELAIAKGLNTSTDMSGSTSTEKTKGRTKMSTKENTKNKLPRSEKKGRVKGNTTPEKFLDQGPFSHLVKH